MADAMDVSIFVVNYKTDDYVVDLVGSIAQAAERAPGTRVHVHVLDNSSKSREELGALEHVLGRAGLPVDVHSTGRNEGYFGVLRLAQSLVEPGTRCVVYCNADLVLESDFFVELRKASGHVGVLAPSIVELARGVQLNPQYATRLPAAKLRMLRAICSSRIAFAAYALASRMKELTLRRRPAARAEPAEIYAPHGSLLVFTDVRFFASLPAYPCFLFGEELFVAEEAGLNGVTIWYEPRLRVSDVRHASTSSMAKVKLRSYSLESISFILDRYYRVDSRRSV